ncbi:hypothetical protein JG688_00017410 [Phytophthora aleatoria]|uniref:Uncharacterized protein n=1 Tax=Phytophthora aleatoria TaxID=2496075 RepID=A0A8J5IQR4_9STRA|nr:hypothetical protein JG688_00017410 [Phytophthora aleatoria]
MKSNPLSDLQALTLCLIRSIDRVCRKCSLIETPVLVIHLTSNTEDKVALATLNDVGFLRVETRSLAEEPRTRLLRVNDAKVLATAKKTSGTFKMIPGVTTVKNRLLYNKFSRWAKKGVDPNKAQAAGKFKNNDEFAMYQVIFRTTKLKKPGA